MTRFVGIDPDLRKNGVAVMEDGVYVSLGALGIVELVNMFRKHAGDPETVFILEDVNVHRPTFTRHGQNEKKMQKISQNVGMVKAIAEVLVEFLSHYGCRFELRAPLKGFAKQAKNDAKLFTRLTGWEGRTNSDVRDAAMLIYRHRGR